jgi:hypothetical protein
VAKPTDKNETQQPEPAAFRTTPHDKLEDFIATKQKQAGERGQPIPEKLVELFRRQVIHGAHQPANYELLWSTMWGK